MSSLRSLLGVGRQALASRLDRLHNTLLSLGERLRLAVADIVGQNVGSVVSQAFAAALSPNDVQNAPFDQWEHGEIAGEEDSFRDLHMEAGEPFNQFHDNSNQESGENRASSSEGHRLPNALSAGLRTAAWWIRRCWSGWAIAGAVSIAIIVGWIAYCNQPLADAGLRMAESTDQIQLLSQAAKVGSQKLLS